jgi:hypothetical protein
VKDVAICYLVVYASHVDVENVQRTVQSACAGLNKFFKDIGLSISESKSELVLFARKHTNLSVCVTLNVHCMSVLPKFRYLGAHVHYIQQKCCKRINFLRSMAGVSWGAHPDVMLILYMGLIRSVLEYDCIAFDRMTGYTHVEVGKDSSTDV